MLFIIIQKSSKSTLQLTTMACRFFECIKILTDDEKKRLCKQFDKYIVKNGDCHLWQGRLDACGYGEIRLMFRGRRITLKAHRAVFAMLIVLTQKIGLNLVDCSSSYSCWYCVHSLV